jgi:hypothetical protein
MDHVANRQKIIQALREELVGPSPQGSELDCSGEISFSGRDESFKLRRQKGSGDEILQRDRPLRRYGVGVLFPVETKPAEYDSDNLAHEEAIQRGGEDDLVSAEARSAIAEIQEHTQGEDQPGGEDFDLSLANTYQPSTMGVSMLVELPLNSRVVVEATGGRYKRKQITVDNKPWTWWLRSGLSLTAVFNREDLIGPHNSKVVPASVEQQNLDEMDVKIETISRMHDVSGARLLTIYIINRSPATDDENCVFQAFFRIRIESPENAACILPYPGAIGHKPDPEEQSIALLYREYATYAVGHGCSASWSKRAGTLRADSVTAECLPVVETASVTPEIKRPDGTSVEVSMAQLAGLVPKDDGFDSLSEVVALYEDWIAEKRSQAKSLDSQHQKSAEAHLDICGRAVKRMRSGLKCLKDNKVALQAFRLANRAILIQQVQSRRKVRNATFDRKTKKLLFTPEFSAANPLTEQAEERKWRPFQIAFFLMVLESIVSARADDRDTVELLWFPTGGGKTEAYLGLAAFSTFFRRLTNPQDEGVNVLMRYTLRLLTAQQFQRACSLICAMEHIRRDKKNDLKLGESPFSIGIWLGRSTTPNTKDQARSALRELQRGDRYAENRFILLRCPWCAAQMGPIKYEQEERKKKKLPRVIGYERQLDTVVFKCPDQKCDFASGMPVVVTDEDIYEIRPSLIIGTVDKFAMLAWEPEARRLFGVNNAGDREVSPPGLIIQDELHLISGPLGSMVGLYEALIEDLCTDRRVVPNVLPKIIASTATIRSYGKQIKDLYGRKDVALFPPPGINADDSFFARYARDSAGQLRPGAAYVGVHAPAHGSLLTTQVRTFTSLLQAPLMLLEDERDPWWTLLLFFNSLRELGTTVSLFQSDIPSYIKAVRNRTGASAVRRFSRLKELTGRLPSDEIPKAIEALQIEYGTGNKPIDVCLASNIIEVGIDIERLSLMGVLGQPKTTSQYIQVTGRVGRRWWERPALVVTIYSASKPRDRSHFEKFRSYHERLYAQVEPTSVTPFSPPALDRALHAVIVGYVRQSGDSKVKRSPYPFPADLVEQIGKIVASRIRDVDQNELPYFEQLLEKRKNQWRRWQRTRWKGVSPDGDIPLLRESGAFVSPQAAAVSWATPTSMREVDAECQIEITNLYLNEADNDDA